MNANQGTLDNTATAIFHKLIDGLDRIGSHRKIGEDGGAFMAVCVDVIDKQGPNRIISIAHYFKQNGDMCCDPDMTFMVTKVGSVWPMTFQQAIPPVYHESAVYASGITVKDEKRQRELVEFANQWMRNIDEQQEI